MLKARGMPGPRTADPKAHPWRELKKKPECRKSGTPVELYYLRAVGLFAHKSIDIGLVNHAHQTGIFGFDDCIMIVG